MTKQADIKKKQEQLSKQLKNICNETGRPREKDICYLYWIHLENHTDIFSEGYIGISNNPEYRFFQHKFNSSNPKNWHNYRTEFRNALSSEKCIMDVLLCSSREYCLGVEEKLRPEWIIGWNRAKGGSGGYGTHGLTGSKCERSYRNLKHRLKSSGKSLCDEWLGEEGVINFCKFLEESVKEGEELFIGESETVGPNTVIISTRKDFREERSRIHDLYGDGNLRTLTEIALMFNMKPNTITTRLCRGLTLRESVGLDKQKPKRVVKDSNQEYIYNGKLSDGELLSLKQEYELGVDIITLGKTYSLDHSNISRLVKKLGFKRPEYEDMFGNKFSLGGRTKMDAESFIIMKQQLLLGTPRYKIAKMLGVSGSCITYMCKKIKWEEYEKSLGNSKLSVEG